jgi:hypothetical protein
VIEEQSSFVLKLQMSRWQQTAAVSDDDDDDWEVSSVR